MGYFLEEAVDLVEGTFDLAHRVFVGGLLILEVGDPFHAGVIQRFSLFFSRVMGMIAEVSDGLRAL